MSKFEISDAMVEAAIAAKALYWFKPPAQNISEGEAMRAAISAAFEASGLVERIAELEKAGKNLTDACHASIRITGIHYTPVISTRFNRAVEAMVEALNKEPTP
jgi:hypothetical protein